MERPLLPSIIGHTLPFHPLQEAARWRIDQIAGLALDVDVDQPVLGCDGDMLGGEQLLFQGQGVGVVCLEAVVPEAGGQGVAKAEDGEGHVC